MRKLWVTLYQAMPPAARSLAATLHGYRLRQWRYAGSERLVEEIEERDRWTERQWAAWSREQLARALHHAATRVPYYREQWAARRRGGDRSSWEDLANWPVLDKDPVRRDPRAFLAEGAVGPLRVSTTSGTSGQAIRIWAAREAARLWYALVEVRWRRWYGFTRHDRWALIGAQMVTPLAERRPPFWVWNGGLRQLYMSAYHLAPETIGHYLDALVRYRVRYLWGHSSALYLLAQEALRRRRRDVELQMVMSAAEPLPGYQRKAMAAAFRCPVRESYGMSEMAAAASECEHGRLHLWPETGWLEAVAGDRPAAPGASGELLSTTFLNRAQPLVRYRVGDVVVLAAPGTRCPCGRRLPILESVEGRVSDCLYGTDGRPVTAAAAEGIFDFETPFTAAQLVQEGLRKVRVRFVADGPLPQSTARTLVGRVRECLGDVEVLLEPTDHIERGAGGKHRAVVCLLPAGERVAPATGAGAAVDGFGGAP